MTQRAPQFLLLLAVIGVIGCAQVKPSEEFAFQTEAERLDAQDATVGDVADATDAADADTSGDDVVDTLDAADVWDSADAPDSADVADAIDAADVSDTADVADVADALDAADAQDVADAVDTADTPTSDAQDVVDAPDAVNLCVDVTCDDGDSCTDDSCLPLSGCNHSPGSGKACSADPCHSDGTCVEGVCKYAAAISCDDSNDCTVDGCDVTTGCSHVALNNGNCVGNLCMISQTCKAGVCQGGSPATCDDGDVCTDNSCNPASGCVSLPNTATCDDGDACTSVDVCAGSKCTGVSKFVDATYGGGGDEDVQKIFSFADGFALAGSSASTPGGVNGFWLVRTGLDGGLLWQKSYVGAAGGILSDAAALSDGFALFGIAVTATGSAEASRLIRTDASGDVIWQQTFPIGVKSAGGLAALSADSGGIAMASSTTNANGDDDGTLTHVDLNGGATWTVSMGAIGNDDFAAISTLGSGYILAGGSSSVSSGDSDFWLVRTNASGSTLWQKFFGGNGEDVARAVIALPDGFLVAGSTTSKGAGGSDAWLVRTDLNGLKLWDKTYGGKSYDDAVQIAAVPGGFAFSGTTASTGAGGKDMWLVRIDAFGNKYFGIPYGGTANDGNTHLAVLPDGFALAGYSGSKGAGGTDAWFLRTDLFGNATCGGSGSCIAKLASDCSDASLCTADLCDATHSGCWHPVTGAFACDDGQKCTGPDTCITGTCVGGPALNCNDGNACTADSCDAEFGCVNETLNGMACGTSQCKATCENGTCGNFTPDLCFDTNQCTNVACSLSQGCIYTSTGKPCDDGDACTSGDLCSQFLNSITCSGKPIAVATVCNDGNVCTDDSCVSPTGCTHTVKSQGCDDANACTTDACDPTLGCTHASNTGACNDGNAATVSDTCSGGACTGCDPGDVSLILDDGGVKKHVCAPDYPRWGIVALSNISGLSDKGNGTVIDANTSLWWQSVPWGAAMNQADARAFCDNLSLATRSDWRLPTRTEMQTTIDFTANAPAASPLLLNTNGRLFWTLTPSVAQSGAYWTIDGTSGAATDHNANSTFFARCVRTDVTGSSTQNRFVLNVAGLTVTDTMTNRIWLRAANPSYLTSSAAQTACGSETKVGGGWRVPEVTEMLSLIDVKSFSPAWDGTIFTGGDSGTHWTATTGSAGTWIVAAVFGISSLQTDLGVQNQVRCVRSVGAPVCDDGNACTVDMLDGQDNCVHTLTPDGTTCNGDACFSGQTCSLGVCQGGVGKDCSDGNLCTVDACSAGSCLHPPMPVGTECANHGFCDASHACVAQMAPIPAGTFWMGCNSAKDSNCNSDESPQHKVTLSAYAMDLTETTVAQYAACVAMGFCGVPSSVQPTQHATYPGLTDNPVNFVNWDQAQQYCKWRGAAFDLPTEAQWEMAARGSCEFNGSAAGDPACAQAMRTYPWGEETATCGFAVMWDGPNGGCGTNAAWAVGLKTAGDSPYGLHDMAGNAIEWSRDWYDTAFYGSLPITDPLNGASADFRVVRGGSFVYGVGGMRAAFRGSGGYPESGSADHIGLRCSRALP